MTDIIDGAEISLAPHLCLVLRDLIVIVGSRGIGANITLVAEDLVLFVQTGIARATCRGTVRVTDSRIDVLNGVIASARVMGKREQIGLTAAHSGANAPNRA